MKKDEAEMKLKNVLRLDNMPITKAHYTEEGYLVDNPIVTSVGIFEYALPDGGTRRELRLPEHVFDPESLASYEGKPVIITHDAGEVDKNNVEEHHIGTILTKGYRDGDDVRAKIVIHDTDAMKESELKELSLGYSLDLDETPGIWEGQHYDAVQTNIRVNHLALVENARAGKQARLNIDSRETLKGAKIIMSKKTNTRKKSKRRDSDVVEEFADAIKAYQERRETRIAENHPADEGGGAEEQTQLVKDRRDRRDEGGDPGDLDAAMNVIAEQDEDIETLLGVVDALCAVEAQDEDDVNEDDEDDEHDDEDDEHEDEGEDDEHEDDEDDEHDDEDDDENCDDDDEHEDDSDSQAKSLNADSVDKLVRERVKLIRTGDRFNVDGIENMGAMQAKKAIIKKLKPSLRLDGKSKTYIDACFDISVKEASARKDTNYQRKQMFNSDSAYSAKTTASGAAESREKMIDRQTKNGGKK